MRVKNRKIVTCAIIFVLMTLLIGSEREWKNNEEVMNGATKEIKQNSQIFQSDLNSGQVPPVEKLMWISPHGELPGTYQEYLKKHPLTPAKFSLPLFTVNNQSSTYCNLSILVDKDLYPKISTNLRGYIRDLESEGLLVFTQSVKGGSPQEIKSWIKTRYTLGSTGFVLIGDITAAWAEVSGSVFPCDFYYMDLDGIWEDQDNDGDFETHLPGEGDTGPEVYVARIYAHSLAYDNEEDLVNEYLAKTHSYRTGELQQPWQGLEYVDEDWNDMPVDLGYIYGDNLSRFDYGYYTTGSDYMEKMDQGQHFVQVCAHSYSGGHHFGTRPTESVVYAHTYIYSPIQQPAKLHLGSDDGSISWLNGDIIYSNDRYGGWHKDAYTIDIALNVGWNNLLCKISQGGGDFMFSARITNQNLESLNGLVYQINNPQFNVREADYIRSWLLNGFHQDTSDRFWEYLTTNYLDIAEDIINPDEGEENGGKTWERYDSGNPYVDIDDYSNNADFGVCYAFTQIYAEKKENCQLWIGYDDGVRVWLNGDVIFFDNRYGELESDMQKINITLDKGGNRLLVKLSEWMGENGFTARICHPDGGPVDGLTYNPEMVPVSWIGKWLINGPYLNPDKNERLRMDYLGNEGMIEPSVGDQAPEGRWERFIGNGCPVNLGRFYDSGDWVLSSDIQERDPPVLFYNLFACGPGRFTDENYLAGSYIYNTTSGLISVASSKSGSMLNFGDFTRPLSKGKCVGEAFREWFDAQAPFQQWEREWYYGMVVCGDPTLVVHPLVRIVITKPQDGIYFKNKNVLPFFTPVILGDIDVEVTPYNLGDLRRVEIYLDDTLEANLSAPPYIWRWDDKDILQVRYTLTVRAYTLSGNYVGDTVHVWRFL